MLSMESFMPSEEECVQTIRELRWPECLRCPICGSSQVTKQGISLEHYQKYMCKTCRSWVRYG